MTDRAHTLCASFNDCVAFSERSPSKLRRGGRWRCNRPKMARPTKSHSRRNSAGGPAYVAMKRRRIPSLGLAKSCWSWNREEMEETDGRAGRATFLKRRTVDGGGRKRGERLIGRSR